VPFSRSACQTEIQSERGKLAHVLFAQAADLRDILAMYQMWAHDMFPKGDFAGTIRRVETVCKTRRMEVGFSLPWLLSFSV